MGTNLTKEELYQRALDAVAENSPTSSTESGIMLSTLHILDKEYHVTYHRDSTSKVWFVYNMTNSHGNPVT
jgi:hypothetical protein